MNLFSTTTNSPVIRGEFNSTNGMTRDEDTLPTIFIGKKENADEFITRTKLKEFRQRYGSNALVLYTWAPTGEALIVAKPIDIILDGCNGCNAYGGNSISVNGEVIRVHDRVETWAEYRALSV